MGNEKPCDFGGGGALEVPGETTASAEPGKGALDHPASGQKLEAFDARRPLDDLDGPLAAMGQCLDQWFAAINPISKDVLKSGKALSQALQKRDGTMDILNVGGMNVDCQQKALGIGDDVPLASVEALARIEAAWAAKLRRRSGLTVNDGSRRGRLAPKFLPRFAHQSSNDPVPPAAISPRIKIALNRRVRRELARQSSPLAAGGQDIENRLYDLAQIDLPGSPEASTARHLPGNQRPLRIGQIACVTQSSALILDTSDFGPRHRALPRIFANPKESQPIEITHSFFRSGS